MVFCSAQKRSKKKKRHTTASIVQLRYLKTAKRAVGFQLNTCPVGIPVGPVKDLEAVLAFVVGKSRNDRGERAGRKQRDEQRGEERLQAMHFAFICLVCWSYTGCWHC